MPAALLRACSHPGCPAIQPGSTCEAHTRTRELGRQRKNYDVRKWYSTARWQALRARVLAAQPFCPDCEAAGRLAVDAHDVDHIIPHRGNPKLFWDRKNLRGLCASCHSRKTQRGE